MSTDYFGSRTETVITLRDICTDNPELRLNPGYFEAHFLEVERQLKNLGAGPLGRFIPEAMPDGSKGITYGQVGARVLAPRGAVRYLQVINIRDTGIDFAIKPDRVGENSHNDPERSRVRNRDILFTNNAFRGTDTLIGRCIVVPKDYGRLNISQHIDRIRVQGVNPFYVSCFLKSKFGQTQIERVMHGVDSSGISFGRIREILIPELAEVLQSEIEEHYLEISNCHERAMAIKERLLEETGVEPGQYGNTINSLANEKPAYRRAMEEAKQRLDHLIEQLEAVIEDQQRKLKSFPA